MIGVNTLLVWKKKGDGTFESLKIAFTLAPILKIVDPYKDVVVLSLYMMYQTRI